MAHREVARMVLNLNRLKNQVEGMLNMQIPVPRQRVSDVRDLVLGTGFYGFNKLPRRFRCRWSMDQALSVPT